MSEIPPEVAGVAAELTSLAVRNTAAIVRDRVRTAKANRDYAAQVTELTEIINDLLSEKTDLITIGQLMNQQLASQSIAEDDLRFITDTLIPTVEKLLGDNAHEPNPDHAAQLAAIKALVAPELLSVLQIVGFNFRDAVGTPLTELVASLIRRTINTPSVDESRLLELDLHRRILVLEVAKDNAASTRATKLMDAQGNLEPSPREGRRRK